MAILTAKLRLKPICVGTAPKKAPKKLAKPKAISLAKKYTPSLAPGHHIHGYENKHTSKGFLSVSMNKDHLEFYRI